MWSSGPQTQVLPASHIQGSLSPFRTCAVSTPASTFAVSASSLLAAPRPCSLLPWGLPALTSPWALSAEPWAASLPLSQLPTPSRAWEGLAWILCLPLWQPELSLPRAQGEEHTGFAGCGCPEWVLAPLVNGEDSSPLTGLLRGTGGVVGRTHLVNRRCHCHSFQKLGVP